MTAESRTLFDFGPAPATTNPELNSVKLVDAPTEEKQSPPTAKKDPNRILIVPLSASRPVIHNFALVREMITEAFANNKKVVLYLTGNAKADEGKPATEWQLWRVVS